MGVWVIEIPKKGYVVWHMEVVHSEELAKRRVKEITASGYKGATCWEMISGAKLA